MPAYAAVRIGAPDFPTRMRCSARCSRRARTVAVAVVSDGHGSARHFRSQIGSSLAVSTVAATLQGFLRESVASNGQVPFVPEQVHELERKIVSGWLAAVHSDLEHNPFTEAELATARKGRGSGGPGGGREYFRSWPTAPRCWLQRPPINYSSTCSSAMARS